MPTKSITIDEFARLVKDLPAAVEHATIRGLRSAGERAVLEVVTEIDNAEPDPAVDSGALRQSVHSEPLDDGYEVVVDAPHAPFMEYGTRPHFPPLGPIFVWVMRKGLASTDEEGEQIAWAIAATIAVFGIEPRHFFRKAMVRVRNKIVPQEINHELAQLARKM